jgi:GAF domain-containing protein/HAMP domain-containing protein
LAIFLLTYSVIESRQAAIDAAERESLAVSELNAQLIHDQLNIPLVTARTLADSLEGIKDPNNPLRLSRAEVNAMLKKIAEENPNFLATYTLWEPNAFDGFDSLYAGKPGHDETGRFIPYWVRRPDGTVTVEPLVGYETPGLGDWYLIPRQTRQEYTVAPLIYPIAGVDTLMATFTVPVVVEGKFYGITGVDAPITFVQSVVDNVSLYNDQAEAVLLTDTGTLIAVHSSPEFTNQPADLLFSDFAELQPRITNGEAFISLSPDGQSLRVFSPVDIGDVGTHWSFSLIIPFSAITAQATNSALLETAIGLALVALALFILWYLTGQIVQPILNLTTVAEAVSQGNLNATAEVQSINETGTLANAFNAMTIQLRETVSGLEQRIADRTRNLELAAEVGRTVSQVRDLDVMLTDAAELIRQQFDLYYVQVYLVNPSKTYLTLEAGTGHVGKELLERNHRLPFNTTSLNGRAVVDRKPVVIANTLKSALFKPNPLLPDTRSEMAVPLVIGDNVVGVLDMQSTQSDALNEDILPAFEALAGQLAIAVQNATFLAETQQARAEVEAQARRLVRSNWENYMDAIHEPEHTGFVFEQNKIETLSHVEEVEPAGENTLAAAITVTGEAVGNLIVEMDEQTTSIHNNQLVEAVARQVAQQIESLRLLESAERFRVEAEEASRRITREGWKNYAEANAEQNLGYFYNLKEVQPYNSNGNQPNEDTNLTLPLKIRDEAIGKLIVQGLGKDDTEGLDLALAVAERLSAHIEGLRQFDETRRGQIELDKRAKQLASVAEISTVSSQELDIQKMLESVVHLTQRQFGLYHAHVFLYNENTEDLTIAACGWKEGDEHEGTHGATNIQLHQEQSLVARAARSKKAVIVNDVRSEPGWLPNPLLPDTSSELAVPLVIGDQVLGVMDIQSDQINAFTEEDANIQTTLASQVATALQNARSFARAQQQAQRETTLNVISQKIQSATTVEAVLQIAARELGHALGAPMTIAQLSMKDSSS